MDNIKPKEKRVILTRAARKKAGVPPPTPLFRKLIIPQSESSNISSHQHPISRGNSSSTTTSSSDEEEDDTEQVMKRKKKKRRRKKEIWVQCDSKECRKWRRLPHDHQIDLSLDWFCHMHPDPGQNLCSLPEQKVKETQGKKRHYTFSLLEGGELVWAKMAGFCPWPAVISPDPWCEGETVVNEREGHIYHVEFLGRDHTHNWIVEEKVEPYHGKEYRPKLGNLKTSISLTRALEEADSLYKLTPAERLDKCVFKKSNQLPPPSTQSTTIDVKKKQPVKTKTHGRPPKLKQLPSQTAGKEETDGGRKDGHELRKNHSRKKAGVKSMKPGHTAGSINTFHQFPRSYPIPLNLTSVSSTSQGLLTAQEPQLVPLTEAPSMESYINPPINRRRERHKKKEERNKIKAIRSTGYTMTMCPQSSQSTEQYYSTQNNHQPPDISQMAEEVEEELKEMEDMLSLFSYPLHNDDHDKQGKTETGTGESEAVRGVGEVMDSSINCILTEMAEIEGLLESLDSAKLVPYLN